MNALQILRRMHAGEDLVSYAWGKTYLGAFSEDYSEFTVAVKVDDEVAVSMDCNRWIDWIPRGEYALARIEWGGWERLERDEQRRKTARQRREALRPYQRQLRGWRLRRRKGPVTYR